MTIVAEVTPTALEVLREARPRVTSAFDVVQLRTLDEADSIAVARHALDNDGARGDDRRRDARPSRSTSPSSSSREWRRPATCSDWCAGPRPRPRSGVRRGSTRATSSATLTSASGLPLALLDADAPLHLEEVRTFFEARILEQPDAVSCVVDRIAMVKAGLTDPTRPLGVFLFLGPTGTGKTEIAKALAEFLFGSPDRLVRIDMSEFQTPDSLERLLSDTTTSDGGPA